MFNYAVIDKIHGGICDRFESEQEAREAYPDEAEFGIEHYTDEQNAEVDAVFAD